MHSERMTLITGVWNNLKNPNNIHQLARDHALPPAGFCGRHNVNDIEKGRSPPGITWPRWPDFMRFIIIHLSLYESHRSRSRSSRCFRFFIAFLLIRLRLLHDRNRRGNEGVLNGNSFVSGLHDHLTRGGRYPTIPTDIPLRLTVKRWVDQFHLIGQRGSCPFQREPRAVIHVKRANMFDPVGWFE